MVTRGRSRVLLGEWLIPLVVTGFVVGPLAHLALHGPDHHHTPDGAVVFAPAGSDHAHQHPHPHGAHGHGPDAEHDRDHQHDAPSHPGHHGDGSAAHLGLSPPPPTPVLVPPRPRCGPPAAVAVRLPAYRPLRGHQPATAVRARAPPA